MNSDFKAASGRLGLVRAMIPARSSSAAVEPVLLRRTGVFAERVKAFRRLFDDGVSARAAKDAIDALAAEGWAMCPIPSDTDFAMLAHDLSRFDVELRRRRAAPDAPDFIGAIRSRHGLSQREFAERLGIDVRTLQNWEQGRNRPDQAVITLMRLFDEDPMRVQFVNFQPVG